AARSVLPGAPVPRAVMSVVRSTSADTSGREYGLAHVGVRSPSMVSIDGGTAMSEPKVIHIDEIEGAHGGVFKPVGRVLGVTAFGVNMEQYSQGHDQYPDHDHANDGQEEVYYVISGEATLTIDGEDHIMRAGSIAYVPA